MNFSDAECRVAEQAIALIFSRKKVQKRYLPSRPEGITSVLVELSKLRHEDAGIEGYTKSQLVNAITKPWAVLFFLGHNADEPDVVEKLADYIERNTYSITAWYSVAQV